MLAALAELLTSEPKFRSTAYGPAPLPGTYPPYKGAPGPKQKACTKAGGIWIGPTGKKWCQMPLSMASPDSPIYYPPGTQPLAVQPAPWPDIGATTPPPVPPDGLQTGYEPPPIPIFGSTKPGIQQGIEDAAVWDAQRQQFVSSSSLVAPAPKSSALGIVVFVAAAGGLLWYIAKQKKAGKTRGI